MAESIGPRLEVKGEKEFRDALRAIDAGLRVNKSEMEKLAAEYDKDNKSVEALTAKNNALNDTIASQAEKVETLQAAVAASAKKYGEADERTMNYRTALNKAEAELINMNGELAKNEQVLERSKTGFVSVTDAINSLTSMLGVQVPPALQGMIDKLDGVSASGAACVTMIVGMVGGLAKLTTETAKTADELLTLSKTSGMTTDQIQELKYMSELVDTSFETIDGSMTKMIRTMQSANTGTKSAQEAFRALGVRIKDTHGNLRDANTVFYEAIDKLGKMRNETERDALSMQIFGKSARDLNPLIEAGSEKLRELAEEAHNVGYVMDEETLQKFGRLDDAMERFSKTGDAIKNSLAQALLPVLTAFFETISKIPTPVLTTLIVLAGVVTTVIMLAKAVNDTVGAGKGLTKMFKEMNPTTLKTLGIILAVVAALILLAIAITAITGKSKEFQESMTAAGAQAAQIKSSGSSIPQYAKGTKFHPGGLAIVGEEGPEVVNLPRGSKVYPTGQGPGGGTTNNYFQVTSRDMQSAAHVAHAYKNARQKERAK